MRAATSMALRRITMSKLPAWLLTLSALFLALPLLGALARTGVRSAPIEVEVGDETRLALGLAAIDPEKIRADLNFIASDELAGRDTPSEGLAIAARYIENRLKRLAFVPGAPGDSYIFEYPLTWRQIAEESSHVLLEGEQGGTRLAFGEDYFIDRRSDLADHVRRGEVVSVGAGSKSEVEEANVRGKWALLYQKSTSTRRTARRVEQAGALGLVIVPGDEYSGKPYVENFAATTKGIRNGTVGPFRSIEMKPVFPKLYLASSAAQKLFDIAGASQFDVGQTLPGVTFRETRALTHPRGYRGFENVCGLWLGSDPDLRDEVIIISAHYDHVGSQGERIWNGADDNGSGTTGLMALAEALASYGPMRRSVLLMWVSGEEKGLWGSEGWAKRPWLPDGLQPIADINMDMIGRNDPKQILITPTKSLSREYNGLTQLAEALAPVEGFERLGSADAYWARSDHMNFARHLGLPVAFLFADVHADYHKPTDTPDKIDYDKVHRVVRLVLRMLDGMQTDELKLHKRGIPTLEEFRGQVDQGRARTDVERLTLAVDQFMLLNGGNAPDSLELLIVPDENGARYFDGSIVDPWGSEYVFEAPGTETQRILSYGADGVPGGEGSAADVIVR